MNPQNQPVKLWKGTTVCHFQPDMQILAINFNDPPTTSSHTTPNFDNILPPDTDLSGTCLDDNQLNQLRNLIFEYKDVFASTLKELGTVKGFEYHIDTGDHPPIKKQPYRQNPIQREIIQKHLKEMEDAGLIEEGTSPWSAPLCLALKKDLTFHVCYDYRSLNSITRIEAAPIPHCEDLLSVAGGARVYTGLDLKSGYNNVALSPESQKKASFVTPEKQYLVKKLGFGLCNAPSFFQQMMCEVLRGLHWKTCLVFIDDVLVATRSVPEHLSALQEIFDRFREYNLKLNPKKCVWARTEIPFLGHLISERGLKCDPAKLKAVSECKCPSDCKDPMKAVRSFLGLCGYYRKFICGFAQIAAPLYALLQKGHKFAWTKECQEAFEQLKVALTSPPTLAYPDWSKKMIIHCDASDLSLGAVLSQVGDDGKERPISYAGRNLKPAEQRMSAYEREVLAILYSLDHFESYLTGVPCDVVTDNRAVSFLLKSPKSSNNRIARWAMKLSTYPNVKLINRMGSRNSNADALSRFEYEIDLSAGTFGQDDDVDIYKSTTETSEDDVFKLQKSDDEWKHIIAYLLDNKLPEDNILAKKVVMESMQYELHDGVLCRIYLPKKRHPQHWVRQICLPKCMQWDIIDRLHKDLSAGGAHWGIDRTLDSLYENYWFKGAAKMVKSYVKQCPTCQGRKGALQRHVGMKEMPAVSRPMERISCDIAGPLPPSGDKGYIYILVITDAYSRYVDAYPLTNQKSRTIAEKLFEFVSRAGLPQYLLTDQGKNVCAEVIQELCDMFHTKKLTTSPYWPQADQTERYIGILKNALAMYCEKQNQWSEYLRPIVFAMNTTPSSTHGYTPFQLFHGRPALTSNKLSYGLNVDEVENPLNYPQTIARKLAEAFEVVEQSLQQCSKRNKYYYDMKGRRTKFAPGQIVYLHVAKKADPVKGTKHFRSLKHTRWQGPYQISSIWGVNCRLVEYPSLKQYDKIVHVNRLKRGYVRADMVAESQKQLRDKWKKSQDTCDVSKVPGQDTDSGETQNKLPQGYYLVDKILKSFYSRKDKMRYYLIKWKGYSRKHASYVGENDISQALKDAYHNAK